MGNTKIGITQQGYLFEQITRSGADLKITPDQLWELTRGITDKQYRYFLALHFNNKYEELEEALNNLIK